MKAIREWIVSRTANREREKRLRSILDESIFLCEKCEHRIALSEVDPLEFADCPKCGFKNYIPLRIDDFLLIEPLGAGGFSSVYKAIRVSNIAQVCAIKLLKPEAAAEDNLRDAFLFEAHVHHDVGNHPNIVPFLGSGEGSGCYYHAMGFVQGDSLRSRVENLGRIPEPIALRWCSHTLAALRHVRDAGYLYRDVSPGNLIINHDADVILVDFGLALPLSEADRARSETFVEGTPEYIPPERIERLGEDERSIIYSLGHLLFFMLKGEPLIRASSHTGAALQHVAALRVAFSDMMLPTDTTPETVQLVGSMIKVEPGDRPQHFEDVAATLDELLKPYNLPPPKKK